MTKPLVIETEKGISVAWAQAFIELMGPGGGRHPSLVRAFNLDALADVELEGVRDRLDAELAARGMKTISTVASTIFPRSFWKRGAADDAEMLYERYERAWPGISRCPANRKGVYFRRLTAYSADGVTDDPINQLRVIAQTYAKVTHRKSALQASLADPSRDHTNEPYGSFPCLQHVTFTPLSGDRLSITGFYARQLHLEKAYGNYLGLYNLGLFMADQMKLKLTEMNCIASFLDLGEGQSKTSLQTLKADIEGLVG